MTQWWKFRWPVLAVAAIILTYTSDRIKGQLDLSSNNIDNATVVDRVGHTIGRRSSISDGIFPTSTRKECPHPKTPKASRDCRRAVYWRNGKFTMTMIVMGLGLLVVLGFTLMTYMRKARARRLTKFHDSAMSHSTQGTSLTQSSKSGLRDDLEAAYRQHVALVADRPEVIRTSEAQDRTVRHSETTALDGMNDRWTLWIRQQGQNSVCTVFARCAAIDTKYSQLSVPVPRTLASITASDIWSDVKLNSMRIKRHNRSALKIRSQRTI